jgi:hypothetical protein
VHWSDYPKKPSKEVIESNAKHIRPLHLYSEPSGLPLESILRLNTLRSQCFITDARTCARLASLVHQNQGLVQVTILAGSSNGPMSNFLRAVLSSTNLRHLTLTSARLDLCTKHLFDVCTRLERLCIKRTERAHLPSMDRWPDFPVEL